MDADLESRIMSHSVFRTAFKKAQQQITQHPFLLALPWPEWQVLYSMHCGFTLSFVFVSAPWFGAQLAYEPKESIRAKAPLVCTPLK